MEINGNTIDVTNEIYNKLLNNLDQFKGDPVYTDIKKGIDYLLSSDSYGHYVGNTFTVERQDTSVWNAQPKKRSAIDVPLGGLFNSRANRTNYILSVIFSDLLQNKDQGDSDSNSNLTNIDDRRYTIKYNNSDGSNNVSQFDSQVIGAYNVLDKINQYLTNPEEFNSKYSFKNPT